MRGNRPESSRSWYRIENAFIDEENKSDEVTKVYIYDEIGDSWWGGTGATDFVQQIAAIKTPKIELHLNSPGGDIFEGVAIYNALKSHSAEVTVIVDALAASAASFIAQAGDKIIMTRAATMMIHDGSGLVWGTAADMRSTADLLDKLSNTVADIYAARAGQSVEFWRNLMIEEVWYNAAEAVEAGLADEIGEDTKQEDEATAQNKWDLSIFNYAGRNAAPNPFQIRQRITNRLKETVVPKNNGEGQPEETTPPSGTPETTNPASPDTNPEAPTTSNPEQTEPEKESDPAPETDPAPEAQPAENRSAAQPTFVLQGRNTTDFKAVQARLNMLEEFRNETLTNSKREFVKRLATDNKIMASQIEKLTNYALSLDDKQYEAWKDTWDGAPGLPMLSGSHAEGITNSTGTQSQAAAEVADEITVKKEIVAQHKAGGMSNEAIMQTPSYQRLMELDPTFKL